MTILAFEIRKRGCELTILVRKINPTDSQTHKSTQLENVDLWVFKFQTHEPTGPMQPTNPFELVTLLFKNLLNLFGKKICISMPCFGITDYNNLQKTIGKTIAYCS